MLLYIIRHGDPDYAADSLTERGRLQAEAVGKRIYDSGINKIYSSPMGRAKETAAPACRLLGLECNIEPWSHEIGDERMTAFPDGKLKSLSLVPNYLYRENGGLDVKYGDCFELPGLNDTKMKEAVKYIEKNGKDFLERLGYKEENGLYRILHKNEDKVALFCHSAFARAWISVLLHIPVNMMWSDFGYTHTGVTILDFHNFESGFTSPRCLCYSDMSHLYAAGLDMCYDTPWDDINKEV